MIFSVFIEDCFECVDITIKTCTCQGKGAYVRMCDMEVVVITDNVLRIKGKNAVLVVDPISSMPKTAADAVLILSNTKEYSDAKIEGHRVVIHGAGEYEIGGIKISASYNDGDLVYTIVVDGIDLLLASSKGLKIAKEKIKESNLIVIDTQVIIDESSVTAIAPNVVLLYGENREESAKVLGKEPQKSSKYVVTLEKLPQEMEVVVLASS